MSKKIRVGNLPLRATEAEIYDLFSEVGSVEWVHLVTAKDTGRSRGKGFVAMANGANKAIRTLHGKCLGGKRLQVRRALPLQTVETASRRTPRRARVYATSAGHSVS